VQDTFFRAFERAHTFQSDGIVDPVQLERRARAWLGRIAERLLADSMKRLQEISASPYLEQLSTDDLDVDDAPSRDVSLLLEALATLSERERDVLSVAATYHRLGERHQRLPNAVSAELAARWGTSSENVRAIRSRALKKLKAYLRERGLVERRES
jgi:DNA-directed RNA polymerase specialized sigma24 family protein